MPTSLNESAVLANQSRRHTYTFRAFLLLLKYVCGTSSSSFRTDPATEMSKKLQGNFCRTAGILHSTTNLSTMTSNDAMLTLLTIALHRRGGVTLLWRHCRSTNEILLFFFLFLTAATNGKFKWIAPPLYRMMCYFLLNTCFPFTFFVSDICFRRYTY